MIKVLRKVVFTTSKARSIFFAICLALVCCLSISFAKTKSAKTETAKKFIQNDYYATGYFEARIETASFLGISFSSIGFAEGGVNWTNSNGETDLQYVDCAIANAVYQFQYSNGQRLTASSPLLVFWSIPSVSTCKCNKVTMDFCKLWNLQKKTKVCDAVKKSIKVEK